jgi:hypothetical protein
MSGHDASMLNGLMTISTKRFLLPSPEKPCQLYTYSRQERFLGSQLHAGACGRCWATPIPPGPWAFNWGIANTLKRIFYTGHVHPFKSYLQLTAPEINLFIRHPMFGLLSGWKYLSRQYVTKMPGSINLINCTRACLTGSQAMRSISALTIYPVLDATAAGVMAALLHIVTSDDPFAPPVKKRK